MRCARVYDGRIIEIHEPRDQLTGRFHPEYIARLVDIPDNAELDWVLHNGEWLAELPPAPLTADDFATAIQGHVDATAKLKGYADGVALAGYSTSTIPAWAAEAAAFIAWRDQVWLYAYTELAKVQGGQREVPTIAELIEELPTINWP